MLRLSAEPLNLPYKYPFTIARWTKLGIENVLVQIRSGDLIGMGEGAPNKRYEEDQPKGLEFLQSIADEDLEDLESLRSFLDLYQGEHLKGRAAMLAALDIAYFDIIGQLEGKRVGELFGLKALIGPATSFTIAIDSLEMIKDKSLEAKEYKVLKVKLGTKNDKEIIDAIRSVSDQNIRIDANEAWKDKEYAIEIIEWLEKQGVELIEQPLPAGSLEDVAWLRDRSPLPIIADEDLKSLKDLDSLKDCYDGINVKVDKAGGLKPARNLIESAKTLGLQVMVGCMGASSLSITAAAHIALDADYVDLDGHLLLKEDTFDGLFLVDGQIAIKEIPGLGVSRKH